MSVFLNFQAIGEVLEETGEPIPDRLQHFSISNLAEVRAERSKVASKISWAFTMRRITPELTSSAKKRKRYDELGKAVKATRSIEAAFGLVGTSMNAPEVDLDAWLSDLRKIREAASSERQRLRAEGLENAVLTGEGKLLTAGDALIAGLAKAYEAAFETHVKFSYNSAREVEGGFVRFCQAVLKRVKAQSSDGKIPQLSADAIRKAWERASDKL
ncbi:hypothetical protein ACLE20_14330 [Rhizobium sp. YIM 134829]|uniref:hypothetical protein n=1 Tax=Rhizobium sp. YIM 134829 TaxID=3390453 RepID=UPI00397E439C